MSDIISLGLWIKRRRKALDLTQDELARRVGCSPETIRKIEADARRPSREIAALLATHLELLPEERTSFIQAARAELGADLLAPPAQSIARGAFVPAPAASSTANAPEPRDRLPLTNLPTQPTALIGREQEVAQIGALLQQPDARLVTLTGPGGIGKTRLGLQIADELLGSFPDGVYFVDLTPVREPPLVISAIAQMLGIKEISSQPLIAQLQQFLSGKHTLLLLDNFEQVLAAAPLLAELLATTSQLKLLVTSRERLHLRGEKEVAVLPLALPPPDDGRAMADDRPDQQSEVLNYTAIQLFLARALEARPDFQVTNVNAVVVAEICTRLDGLPLAIELAAARSKLLLPEALLARLNSRLALLTGGARDLPPRQQTIRSTIAWSYDLLSEPEQALFRRLGVFVGGCTLQAAEDVLMTGGRTLGNTILRTAGQELPDNLRYTTLNTQTVILDGLAALVDKSLLRQAAGLDGEPRFAMLETIREYALELLEASGEADIVRGQHAHFYLDFSSEQPAEDDDAWARRVNPDYDNLRAAQAWSQTAAGDSEAALKLALVLASIWFDRGARREAITTLQRALEHPHGVGRTRHHAYARHQLAHLLGLTGNYRAAKVEYEQSLELAREIDDTWLTHWVISRLGWLAREQGDSATAWARLSDGIAMYRQQQDNYGLAWALTTIAEVAILDENPAKAEELLAESRALPVEGDMSLWLGWTINHLGHAAQLRGEYARAAELHHESMALFRGLGEQNFGLPWAYHSLGETALGQGRPDEAAGWFGQALVLSRTLDDMASVAWCLAGLGSTAALDEEPERAARLWGAAERLRQSIGCRTAPAARATYERAVAVARAEIGEQAFAAAWTVGQAQTLEQAIAEALGPG